MTKYGFSAVQQGSDLRRASGFEYTATSEWPQLKIKKIGTFTYPASAASEPDIKLYEHNNNYFMPFMAFEYYNVSTSGSGATYDTSKVSLARINDFYMTKNALMYQGGGRQFQGYYVVFDYNLEKPFAIDKNIADINPKGSTGNKYGIAVKSDNTSRLTSGDMRNYKMNTKARSMSVHLNDVYKADNISSFTISHNLGYRPSYLVFNTFVSGESTAVPSDRIYTLNNPVTSNSYSFTVKGAQAALVGYYYYIIMKEPFLVQ